MARHGSVRKEVLHSNYVGLSATPFSFDAPCWRHVGVKSKTVLYCFPAVCHIEMILYGKGSCHLHFACQCGFNTLHVDVLFCLLVAYRPSNMRVYLRDGSAQTIFTCCHTEIEAADQTFHLTQSQYTDTGSTSPSADPITPGAWQGSHWSANF